MANETLLANIVHQTDVMAGMTTEAFIQTDNVFPLVLTEVFPDNTNVIKFGKIGTVTGQAQAEAAAYSYGANDQRIDTSTTVTGTKKSSAQKITLEALRFSGPLGAIEKAVQNGVKGLLKVAAAEFKTLFSGISGSVGTTNTILTVATLFDAKYTIESSVMSGGLSPKLILMSDYKGVHEITKELAASTASAYNSQVELGILGLAKAGQPKADMFDILIYPSSGLPTANAGVDDVNLLWDPALTFCAGIDGLTGFKYSLTEPTAATPWYELFMYTFWNIAEHNDAAGCRIISKT